MNKKNIALRSATAVSTAAFATILLTACEGIRESNIPYDAWVEDPSAKAAQETVYFDPILSSSDDKVIIPTSDLMPSQPQDNIGVTDVQFTPESNPPEIVTIPKTTAPAVDGGILYKVQKNDSLWSISMIYGVSVDRLAEVNGLDKKAVLPVGKVLTIPPEAKNTVNKPASASKKIEPVKKSDSAKSAAPGKPATQIELKEGEKLYVVKSGDTLSEIAYANRVKTANLAKANNIEVNDIIRVNQTLVIPAPDMSLKAPVVKAKTNASAGSTTSKPASNTASTAKTDSKTTTAAVVSTPKKTDTETEVTAPKTDSIVSAPKTEVKVSDAPAVAQATEDPGTNTESDAVNQMELTISIESPMTLEKIAQVHDRDVKQVYELNPSIAPGAVIPAGTVVKIPLF